MNNIQQGDVLIQRCDLPKDAIVRSKNSIVLAEGEYSGHFHGIECDGAELLEYEGARYMRLPTSAVLKHQVHKPINIPAGTYKIGIVQEYDYFSQMARNVRD